MHDYGRKDRRMVIKYQLKKSKKRFGRRTCMTMGERTDKVPTQKKQKTIWGEDRHDYGRKDRPFVDMRERLCIFYDLLFRFIYLPIYFVN